MHVPEIITTIADGELFFLFRKQLEKDLAHAGLEPAFVESLAQSYEPMLESLTAAFEKAIAMNPSFASRLINRVDISERQMKEAAERSAAPLPELLAELVIRRVLQKVIIRKRFSG
jgi:hypothetical protein